MNENDGKPMENHLGQELSLVFGTLAAQQQPLGGFKPRDVRVF